MFVCVCVRERTRAREQERWQWEIMCLRKSEEGRRMRNGRRLELQRYRRMGLCAFTLKSQSHIVLFLKRKSEGLAQALPWKPWINIRLPFCAYIIHHRMKPPNGGGFLALRHMKRQWNYPPMQPHGSKTDHWGRKRRGAPGGKGGVRKKRNLLVTWALW